MRHCVPSSVHFVDFLRLLRFFLVLTSLSNAIYGNSSEFRDDVITIPHYTNGAQDPHENLLCIGDATFPGLSNQNELN